MQRKIIQQSATSMGISLPSKWVKKWNLAKGNIVNIDEVNGILEIKPVDFRQPEKKAEIDTKIYGNLTARKFDNLSKRGYDEIKVLYSAEKELEPIKDLLLHELTMFEIVKKEKDCIIARAISEINKEELDRIVSRLVFLLIENINKTRIYLQKEEKNILNDILETENAINRLYQTCMRALNRQPPEEQSYMRYTFIWVLEKLGDDFKFFAKSNPVNISKETKIIINKVLDNLKLVIDIFFKYDTNKAYTFYNQRKKIVNECIILLRKKTNVNDHLLVHFALSMNEKGLYLLGLLLGLSD